MSLVGRVGRKRVRARLAMALLYFVLSAGALTTLYPFAVMITTGMKGPTDQNDNRFIPAFFKETETLGADGGPDPSSLYAKYLNDKYSGDASQIASTRIEASATTDEVNRYKAFLMALPVDRWSAGFRTAPNQVTSRLAVRYQAWLRDKFTNIEALNVAYVEENTAFQTIAVPAELLERLNWKPRDSRKYREWLEFKSTLPAEYRIPIRLKRLWQEFLRATYENQFDRVPEDLKRSAEKFENLDYPRNTGSASTSVVTEFESRLPERLINLMESSVERGKYPIAAYELAHVRENKSAIAREFATRNYAYVFDYVVLHGRALWNTAIFCLLAIGVQLTVNPLAAYALSRFPIKASGKILLFLLATMAFPAEVAMIPSFLLLKDLGLLNTFAALVLPTAASGYMIFLLKGFFDSLPPELFESGQIDGAKESTMMFRIALPLSKPVMGYMALMAFMGAYGAFLYAFLVAQDQRIWTLMVFIYQLQSTAPKAVMMAALTLAALPTLLVFLFAQRAIMRGIILPGEK